MGPSHLHFWHCCQEEWMLFHHVFFTEMVFYYNNHNLFVYTKITFDVWFRILAEIPVSLTHLWNVRTKLLYIYKLKDIFYRTWAVLLAFIFLCYSYHGCILLTVRQAKGLLMFAVGLQLVRGMGHTGEPKSPGKAQEWTLHPLFFCEALLFLHDCSHLVPLFSKSSTEFLYPVIAASASTLKSCLCRGYSPQVLKISGSTFKT